MDDMIKSKLPQQFQPLFQTQKTQLQENTLAPFREPYILRGYRINHQPWHYYFLSLVNWHNETLNVWTHLLAFIYILLHTIALGETYDLFYSSKGAIILGYAFGALSVTFFSTIAHLLHSKSLKHHYIFFMLDYFGVSVYSMGCGILTLYTFCPEDTFNTINVFYLPMHLILCYNNFLSISVAKLYFMGSKRKYLTVSACVASTLSMIYPLLCTYFKCFVDENCLISSLNHLGLMYVFLSFSTIAYLAHQPEMSRPGVCDIIGHSHQWFHIFIFCTILAQFNAMEIETSVNKIAINQVYLSNIIQLYLILISICVLTFLLLMPALRQKVREIENTCHIKYK